MNLQVQNFLLVSVLPSLVVPLLIALVAILGVARWRRTLLVLALVEMSLLALGALALRVFSIGAVSSLPVRVIEFLQEVGNPLIVISIGIATIGQLLALTLAARARHWGWFVALLLTAIMSVLAAEVAFSPYSLIILFGYTSTQAMQIFAETPYVIITNSLAGLTMLVQLLYALLGPREPHIAPIAPAVTPASANDVTLP